MSGRGLRAVRRAARYLHSYGVNTAAVLLYHRVVDLDTDPQLLSVTPAHFADHLDIIRTCANPVTLAELADAADAGRLPQRAVVVTFDDGYRDNVDIALPLLQRFDMPATVYVATGNLDGHAEFYWDELAHILLEPGDMPASVTVDIGGRSHAWHLGKSTTYTRAGAERDRRWTVQDAAPAPRQHMYRDLCGLLRPLPQTDRDGVLRSLKVQARIETRVRRSHSVMTPDDVRSLAACSLVDVGAHSVTHPVLAALPPEAQRDELSMSKSTLEAITGRPVTSCAYPFGTGTDYDSTTTALVRELGFRTCCANVPESVRAGADRFQLPRFLVRDWDRRTFAKRLAAMFRQ